MRLSMAGTSTSTVYLLMFAGCPSTAEVRILFLVTDILLAAFVNSVLLVHNRHSISLTLTSVSINFFLSPAFSVSPDEGQM